MRGAGQDVQAGGQAVRGAFSKSDSDKADRDRDGTLDRQEAQSLSTDVAQNFDAMDTDHDGTVSQAEIKSWHSMHTSQ